MSAQMVSDALHHQTPSLRVKGLGVQYGALVALQDVSWSVAPGELLGIIGPNGAGKSSSYDAITAMVARSGQIFLDERDISNIPAHKLSSLGLKRAFQQNAFFEGLTTLQNMIAAFGKDAHSGLFASIFRPLRAAKHLEHVAALAAQQLNRFQIPEQYHHLYPTELPYGVQRMLSIAIAYGSGAKVLLLDEPAAGLGGADMEALKRLLAALKQEGVAIVVIEHHMDLIMSVADKIFVLNLGRELGYGPPEKIQQNAAVLEAYLGKVE